MAIDDSTEELPRKKLRVGVVPERAGINAVKALFERHQLVVQEYDTRNDYGKDLVIDLTEDGEVTGAMIAAQVKSGETFFTRDVPYLPVRLNDIRSWADSTVPVIGIVFRPSTDQMYWVNLSEHCRALAATLRRNQPSAGYVEQLRLDRRLDDASLPAAIGEMRAYAKSVGSEAYLALLDDDDAVRCDGVFTCWTYGRGDWRAFVLLRRVLPVLKDRSFLDAVWAMNALVGNPDMFGRPANWIPQEVRQRVYPHLAWTAEEVVAMYHEHERLDEEGDGWQRGGTGQMLWHLLNPLDIDTVPPFREALAIAVERRQLDTAFRLLMAVQWVEDDAMAAITETLTRHPELNGRQDVNMLAAHVAEFGRAWIY